jgi:mRNA-degrading endonuclease RelE of RelBE toxin-antitoxin system
MSWKIEVKPAAEKQYLRLDKETRQRIKKALLQLESLDDPFSHHNVRPLTGLLKGDCRLRVGDWRILFTPDKNKQIIYVYAILTRGKAYR